MKKPNPAYESAPYELAFRFHGEPPLCMKMHALRFTKAPPTAVWRDSRKFARWARKYAVKPYLA